MCLFPLVSRAERTAGVKVRASTMETVIPKAQSRPICVMGRTTVVHSERKLAIVVNPAIMTGMVILVRALLIPFFPVLPSLASEKTFSTTWTPYATPTAMRATGKAVVIAVMGTLTKGISPMVHIPAIQTLIKGSSIPLKFLKNRNKNPSKTTHTRGGRNVRSLII